jgi:hypothetical protein
MHKILFINDLTAISGENFIKLLISRLNAKNILIKSFDPANLTKNYLKLYNKNTNINSKEFYQTYLTILYTYLTEIKRLNEEITFEKDKDTYYLIDDIPFLYNIFEENNKETISLFNDLKSLHKYMSFINLNSLTEFKIDNVEFCRTYHQNEIYKCFNIKTKEERINTIELLKDKTEEAFMFFRKNNINCIKTTINYFEDIPQAIKKVFDCLHI